MPGTRGTPVMPSGRLAAGRALAMIASRSSGGRRSRAVGERRHLADCVQVSFEQYWRELPGPGGQPVEHSRLDRYRSGALLMIMTRDGGRSNVTSTPQFLTVTG